MLFTFPSTLFTIDGFLRLLLTRINWHYLSDNLNDKSKNAIAKSFQISRFVFQIRSVVCACSLGLHKMSIAAGSVLKAPLVGRTARLQVCRASSRPMWLTGAQAPPYLDGTLPGDYGFDPLSLGADPDRLAW